MELLSVTSEMGHFQKIVDPKRLNPMVLAAQQKDLVEIIFLPGWKMLCTRI
jgi:hypothetical protein